GRGRRSRRRGRPHVPGEPARRLLTRAARPAATSAATATANSPAARQPPPPPPPTRGTRGAGAAEPRRDDVVSVAFDAVDASVVVVARNVVVELGDVDRVVARGGPSGGVADGRVVGAVDALVGVGVEV